MSSLRVNRTTETQVETAFEWVDLRAPQAERPVVASPQGVVLSIAGRRRAAKRGERRSQEVIPVNDYGSGDEELATEIETDIADRWDD